MVEVTFKEIKTGLHLGQMQVTKEERRIQRSIVLPVMAYLLLLRLYGSEVKPGEKASLFAPDCTPVLQNEEHFVIETPAAERFAPGDVVFAIPTHICPTCAMHQRAYIVEGGRVAGTWDIAARDRVLSI